MRSFSEPGTPIWRFRFRISGFSKQRETATALIPDDLVLKTNLLGTQEQVRDRLRAYQNAGVNTITVSPEGETLDERFATLDQLLKLVDEVNAEAVRS